MRFSDPSWRRTAAAATGGLLAGALFALLILQEGELPSGLASSRPLKLLRALRPGDSSSTLPSPPSSRTSGRRRFGTSQSYGVRSFGTKREEEEAARAQREFDAVLGRTIYGQRRSRAESGSSTLPKPSLEEGGRTTRISDAEGGGKPPPPGDNMRDALGPTGRRVRERGEPRPPSQAGAEVRARTRGEVRRKPSFERGESRRWHEVAPLAARAEFEGRMAPLSEPLRAALRGKEKPKRSEKESSVKTPRFKPPTLGRWLGKDPLSPPSEKLVPPSFAYLRAQTPPQLPSGEAVRGSVPPPKFIEALSPAEEEPDYAQWRKADGRRKDPHWHEGETAAWLHIGAAWGAGKEGCWAWTLRKDGRWWTPTSGSPRMVRHEGRWWWRTRDGWFVLHEGEPWLRRRFAEWALAGLIHPATGTRIVYSEDGLRAAVVTPGEGWVVFDARSGEELARGL